MNYCRIETGFPHHPVGRIDMNHIQAKCIYFDYSDVLMGLVNLICDVFGRSVQGFMLNWSLQIVENSDS